MTSHLESIIVPLPYPMIPSELEFADSKLFHERYSFGSRDHDCKFSELDPSSSTRTKEDSKSPPSPQKWTTAATSYRSPASPTETREEVAAYKRQNNELDHHLDITTTGEALTPPGESQRTRLPACSDEVIIYEKGGRTYESGCGHGGSDDGGGESSTSFYPGPLTVTHPSKDMHRLCYMNSCLDDEYSSLFISSPETQAPPSNLGSRRSPDHDTQLQGTMHEASLQTPACGPHCRQSRPEALYSVSSCTTATLSTARNSSGGGDEREDGARAAAAAGMNQYDGSEWGDMWDDWVPGEVREHKDDEKMPIGSSAERSKGWSFW